MSSKGGHDKIQDEEVMEKGSDVKEKRLTKTQSTFLKLFDCPVCFERISPPTVVCVNGHAVCRECKKQLLTCPTCKAPFSPYKNTMIDQIIEENTFLCKYSDRGCTSELKFHAIEEHEKKYCRHRTLKCQLLTHLGAECDGEVPVLDYYMHVLRNHRQESINFRSENHRTLNISEDRITKTNILKNASTQKILLETVKLDRAESKFYIVFQHIGLYDDSVVSLRIYNNAKRYKELVYRNECVPVGLTEEEVQQSDKCLVLDPKVLRNFTVDDVLTYSIKIDTIPKKWLQVIKDKISNASFRVLNGDPGSSSASS